MGEQYYPPYSSFQRLYKPHSYLDLSTLPPKLPITCATSFPSEKSKLRQPEPMSLAISRNQAFSDAAIELGRPLSPLDSKSQSASPISSSGEHFSDEVTVTEDFLKPKYANVPEKSYENQYLSSSCECTKVNNKLANTTKKSSSFDGEPEDSLDITANINANEREAYESRKNEANFKLNDNQPNGKSVTKSVHNYYEDSRSVTHDENMRIISETSSSEMETKDTTNGNKEVRKSLASSSGRRSGNMGTTESFVFATNDWKHPHFITSINRDFNTAHPLGIRFQTKMPPELYGSVSQAEYLNTIKTINKYFEEAEKINCCSTFRSILAYITCNLIHICTHSRYEKAIFEIQKFIYQQNAEVYHPIGLHIVHPLARGFRKIVIRNIHGYNQARTQSRTD